MKKTVSNSYYIHMNRIYKCVSIMLLIVVLLMGILYKNMSKVNKTKKVNIIKREIVNPNVVFFGDSITDYYDLDKYFPNVKKVNSGISGNRTWDLKDDMYNRLYRYNPSKIVLLIGINNYLYENSSVETVVDDIKEIGNNIHKELPNSEIIIQSIYPVNDDWQLNHNEVPQSDTLTKKIIDSNDKIKKYCEEKNYIYIDMFKELSDDNCEFKREYTDDGLHPNEKGYEKITQKIKKYL